LAIDALLAKCHNGTPRGKERAQFSDSIPRARRARSSCSGNLSTMMMKSRSLESSRRHAEHCTPSRAQSPVLFSGSSPPPPLHFWGPSLHYEEKAMTEKQLHARIERLRQLICGLAQESARFQHTHGPHALELTAYAVELQIA
jgi:hypothetical protein